MRSMQGPQDLLLCIKKHPPAVTSVVSRACKTSMSKQGPALVEPLFIVSIDNTCLSISCPDLPCIRQAVQEG